jgi:hypothetical protein
MNEIQGVAGLNPAVPTEAPQHFVFAVGPFFIAETQAGRPDSVGSRSGHASGAGGG